MVSESAYAEASAGEGGGGVPKFEPKMRLIFGRLDKSIQELRAMYKAHPEWFEAPKQ